MSYIGSQYFRLHNKLPLSFAAGKKTGKKVLKKKPKGKEKATKSQSDESDPTPVRQSRRIAQQKIKEEADRRQLEEVALRELKMIHKKRVCKIKLFV